MTKQLQHIYMIQIIWLSKMLDTKLGTDCACKQSALTGQRINAIPPEPSCLYGLRLI